MSSKSTIEDLRFLSDQFGYYFGFFNLVFGIFGNFFLILFFTNSTLFRRNQCCFYFIVESISNIGLLITIYSSRLVNFIYDYDPTLISPIWCKLRTSFAQIFGFYSLSTTCFASLDQYLSTHHLYSIRKLSSLKLAQYLCSISFCFISIHSIVFLIFVENHLSMGCTVYHPIVKKYVSFFYYPFLSTAFPFLTTISFGLFSYRNVRRIIRRQLPLFRRRLDRQMTALVLARVLIVNLTGFPFIIVTIYSLNINNDQFHFAIISLIGAIFYSLLYTNFSITFYVFLVVSSRFRRQFKYFLSKKYSFLRRTFSLLIQRNLIHRNQIVPQTNRPPISSVES